MSVLLFVLLRRLQAAGHAPHYGALIAGLFAINPLVGHTIAWGHPEELLAGSLCALAVLAAGSGRPWTAGIVLGLALGTKQWALVAILPVLLSAPARRLAVALAGGAVAVALTAFVLASLTTFAATTRSLADSNSWVAPPNVWWPLATRASHQAFDGVALRTVTDHSLPAWLNAVPHPLVLLVAAALGAALWRLAPRPGLDRALALLALALSLRCMLDPWNNVYYHAPFLLALFAHGAVAAPRRPLAAVTGAVLVWMTFDHLWPSATDRPDLVFGVYIAWSTAFAAWLGANVFLPHRVAAYSAGGSALAPTPAAG